MSLKGDDDKRSQDYRKTERRVGHRLDAERGTSVTVDEPPIDCVPFATPLGTAVDGVEDVVDELVWVVFELALVGPESPSHSRASSTQKRS